INQFLGDGFMALFGAPIALEDHAHRALYAALEIRRDLDERPLWPGESVHVRIGLNSGAVVVGKIGDDLRADYTAVGDVTNVAARLQQLAQPDDIIVSAATHDLGGDAIRFEGLGAVALQGKTVPVTAYRVVGLGARGAPLRSAEARPLTPFVGRVREMRV